MNSLPNSHTHCQAAQANAQTKAWQKVCLFNPDKIELKKSSLPSKNKNTQPHKPTRQRWRNVVLTMVCKDGQTEHQPVTEVWRKGGGSASYDNLS